MTTFAELESREGSTINRAELPPPEMITDAGTSTEVVLADTRTVSAFAAAGDTVTTQFARA
jgi:hypothetical protein